MENETEQKQMKRWEISTPDLVSPMIFVFKEDGETFYTTAIDFVYYDDEGEIIHQHTIESDHLVFDTLHEAVHACLVGCYFFSESVGEAAIVDAETGEIEIRDVEEIMEEAMEQHQKKDVEISSIVA
jgi:hypothetical protein